MAQPWPYQGQTPLSDDTSRPKQDRRRQSKRTGQSLATNEAALSKRTSHTPASGGRNKPPSLPQRSGLDITEYKDKIPRDDTASHSRYRANEVLSYSNNPPQSVSTANLAQDVQMSNFSSKGSVPSSKGRYVPQHDIKAITRSETDAESGIRTAITTGPPTQITAPELQRQGIYAHKSIVESRKVRGGTGNEDRAIPQYKIKASIKDSFKVGNVIELRFVQQSSHDTTLTHRAHDVGLSRRRRFVVIREAQRHSMVLSISTYGGRGVAAQNVVKAHHSIIYTGTQVPPLLYGEGPSRGQTEPDSLRRAIKVEPNDRLKKLDEHSRLNYATIYQITHSECEIHNFGAVADASTRHLLYQFNAIQDSLPVPFQTVHWDGTTHDQGQDSHLLAQSGPSRARVDSVQQRTGRQDALKGSTDGDSHSVERASSRPSSSQQTRAGHDPALSAAALAQQMSGLSLRAQNAEVDLRALDDHQRTALARMSTGDQTRYLLSILQRQSPQRHAQVVAHIRQTAAAEGHERRESGEDSADQEDSDDEEDEESSGESDE